MLTNDSPLRERVIGFLVWTAVAGSVAAPILFFGNLHYQIFNAFRAPPPATTYDPFNVAVDTPPPRDGVVARFSPADRRAQGMRLLALSATPEMALGWAKRVLFLVVTIDPDKPRAPMFSEDGYRLITLDLDPTGREAVVVVADVPIRWTIRGAERAPHPQVAFEGGALFDVASAPAGVIAGFRMGGFGAMDVSHASDGAAVGTWERGLCRSSAVWTQHFGLARDAIRIVQLVNPTTIHIGADERSSDATQTVARSGSDMIAACHARGIE